MFRFPIIRLTLSLILGIAVQQAFGLALSVLLLSAFALALCFLVSHCLPKNRPKLSLLSILSGALLFGTLGAISLATTNEANSKEHYANLLSDDRSAHVFTLVVREKLKFSKRSARYVCLVERVDSIASKGKVLFVCPKDSSNNLIVGSRIRVSGALKLVKPAMNPGQFDYGAYLKNKDIFAQLYGTRIARIGLKTDAWYFADQFRIRILTNTAKSGFGRSELPVFAALMLGQQQQIDADIVKDYQYSGAVHILSVSGLHVGFLMLLMQALFSHLPNSRKWNAAKLALTLFSLWGFAFVAGLSASVVRSVVMFSFVALGKHLGKNTNIFNTLFSSMLLILVVRPGFLFDVGFQLSYLAVFCIVWLKPIFDRHWKPKNRVLVYVADILKVSFAAQIGTLPLSLFYFHQFPLLFFVTNLLVIPALAVIMSLGLLTLLWACCAPVASWLGWLTCKSIWLLDEAIAKVASCENFVFKDIGFSVLMLMTGYVVIVAFGHVIQKASFTRIVFFLLAILSVQCGFLWIEATSNRVREFVVFHNWKHTLLASKIGNKIVAFSSDTSRSKTRLIMQPYAMRLSSTWALKRLPNLISFNKKRILIIDSSGIYPKTAKPDYVLLCASPKINTERLVRTIRPKFIIADGSNRNSFVEMWKRTCKQQKIPFHATAEKGSFILKGTP